MANVKVLVSNHCHVFAGGSFKKGDLVLVPMGTLHVMDVGSVGKNQTAIKCKNLPKEKVYVVHPSKFDINKQTGWFCPYWMVKEGTLDTDCIMTRQCVKHGSLESLCYINSRKVEVGNPLLLAPVACQDDVESPAATARKVRRAK